MRGGDQIDTICHYDWRPGRLQILGITMPDRLEPKERLGKLRCTLGSIQDEKEGAGYTAVSQNWPEFRNANGLMVQRAFLAMPYKRRRLMDMRYTWNDLGFSIKMRAQELGISVPVFWVEVAMMKSFIDGFIATSRVPVD